MSSFFHRHLDPATRLGEVLFGLIMALGITGAVRLSTESVTNRELFIAILGCNLAWGVVDGVMFAMLEMFERGRRTRIQKAVQSAATDEMAVEQIAREFHDRLQPFTTAEERQSLYRSMLLIIRRMDYEPVRLLQTDILGGIAVSGIILTATMPILLPFVLIEATGTAIAVSNLIAISLLFWLGCQWGRAAGAVPVKVGAGVTCIGILLVLITIALGG